jgi:hypothetical protein
MTLSFPDALAIALPDAAHCSCQGAIATRWNLGTTPTRYVLDRQGAIRHKWLGSPGAKAIDAALDGLLK